MSGPYEGDTLLWSERQADLLRRRAVVGHCISLTARHR
jgi:hypothetical protein